MKVLFATRHSSGFSIYRSIIEELIVDGATVRCLFDKIWSQGTLTDAVLEFQESYPEMEVGWLKTGGRIPRRIKYIIRELRSYASYYLRESGHDFYAGRQRRYLNGLFPRKWSRIFEKIRFWQLMARSELVFYLSGWIDRHFPPPRSVQDDLEGWAPDVVVATPTNLRYANEVDYLRAAQVLGIPTLIPVFTWDNLTTKGLIPHVPDRLLVWNDSQRFEACAIHRVPDRNIRIIGSPLFDKWFESNLEPLSWIEFAMVGIEPQSKYVLYLGSSDDIAGDESGVPVELADALEAELGTGMPGLKILVRPHMANERIFEDLRDPRIIVWTRGEEWLPDTRSHFALYLAFLKYAQCIVGINTTGMVDAALYGQDVITLNLSRYRGSNAREADHIRIIADAGIFFNAESINVAVSKILEKIAGDRIVPRQRIDNFIDYHVRPRGRTIRAGRHAADEITRLAGSGS